MALLAAILAAVVVFRVKTKDGVYVVEVDEPNADVYVDGHKATTVTWDDGGKKAEIRVKPGTHQVEVKKDGVTAYGQEVTVEEGRQKIITARFDRETKELPKIGSGELVTSPPDKGEEIRQIRWARDSMIYTANFSPDDRRCLISGERDETFLYDVQSGLPVGRQMKGYVTAFLPGGKEIITGEKAGSVIHIYDLNGEPVREFRGNDELWNFTVSPRGDRLLTMSPGTQRLLDLKDGREVEKWLGDPGITTLFSPDGQYLFRQVDGKVPWRVYRTDTGEQVQAFENITGIDGLRGFFPDGQRVFGKSNDGVYVYAVNSGKKVEELDMGISLGNPVTLSPDGKRLLTVKDRQVHLWDLASRQELCTFTAGDIGKLHHLTLNFSADGRYACAGARREWCICGVCRRRRPGRGRAAEDANVSHHCPLPASEPRPSGSG